MGNIPAIRIRKLTIGLTRVLVGAIINDEAGCCVYRLNYKNTG